MKYLILFLFIILSCKPEKESHYVEQPIKIEIPDSINQKIVLDTIQPAQTVWYVGKYSKYVQIEIDGCEYLYDENYNLSVPGNLVHKGNCKNKIHYETKRDR